jgi:hypothetical protein
MRISIACIKFKSNFGLKSYFFYFTQSLFKIPSYQFFISNSILFKYYFFINFLLLFSIQLKPNINTQKKPTATSSKFYKSPNQIYQNSQPSNKKKGRKPGFAQWTLGFEWWRWQPTPPLRFSSKLSISTSHGQPSKSFASLGSVTPWLSSSNAAQVIEETLRDPFEKKKNHAKREMPWPWDV